VILYVGLGMVCIGLVITFVGICDKGFQTLELKLIGPSLVGCGVFFALLRILFCTVPAVCNGCFGGCCRNKNDEKEKLLDVGATNINNSLNRTMTGVNMVNSRIRTIKHPVTGDRRVPKLSSRPPANVTARLKLHLNLLLDAIASPKWGYKIKNQRVFLSILCTVQCISK